MGCAPADAIVVGDTGWDVDSALAAGLRTVAVCSGGWTRADLTARGAIEVHDDVEALRLGLATSVVGGGPAGPLTARGRVLVR